MVRHLRLAALLLTALALSVPPSFAQQNATLSGAVTDESRAVLPGVTVTATDRATGRVILDVTNERGEYRLQNMPAGRYKIVVELPGFTSVQVPEIELLVGQNATLPILMKVATVQETVTVTGESPLVDLTSSQVSGNVDRRQMEQLPLAGRNWIELSLQIKGITANNVDNRPGVENDDAFQLNLDGQQITNKVASSGFGQPKFSREAIAEFQIVTNLFDITQGRSIGIQVQAISKSGTNSLEGSIYGYFRDDKFNSADFVARRVLPFQNQQTGGSFGGPIVRDKWHFFGSYEYERQPNTAFFKPVNLPSQSFSFADKQVNHSALGRVDHNWSPATHLSYRYSVWDFDRPFDKQNEHPTQAASRTRHANNILASWSHVRSDAIVEELRVGYNTFGWTNGLGVADLQTKSPAGWSSGIGTPSFNFINGIIGPPQNFPQEFNQRQFAARYDLTWTRGRHELKIGGEFLGWKDSGEWHLGERGIFNFRANPADLERRFPANANDNPAAWDITGLDSFATIFLQNTGNWDVDIPRPTYGVWIGDNWRVNSRLTLNYGVRYDLDQRATAPPDVKNTKVFAPFGGPLFKSDIHDNNNVAPRVGFAWNVTENNDLVIRGGSGLYYGSIISNITFSQQSFGNRIIVNSFPNDGRPGWLLNPTRNFTPEQVKSGSVPQAPRVIAHDFAFPVTWQSAIGFQKQLSNVLGFEVDLTHWREYNRQEARDINLVEDPRTGYPAPGVVADPAWGPILWLEAHGKADYLGLASGLTRRFANNFQAGTTYTLVFHQRDNTPPGFGPSADNPLRPNDPTEWTRSQDYQRHTLRFNGIWTPGWGITASGAYQFGSGNYYQTTVGGNPFGKSRAALGFPNRLYIGAAPFTINTSRVGDRYLGPTVLNPGDRVPRNALRGRPIHKVDLRLTKTVRLGTVQLQGIAEVFNVFNHENFGNYNAVVTSPTFGAPLQNLGNAYAPRTGQFAFRIQF